MPAPRHHRSIGYSSCGLDGGAVRRGAAGNPLLISQRRPFGGAFALKEWMLLSWCDQPYIPESRICSTPATKGPTFSSDCLDSADLCFWLARSCLFGNIRPAATLQQAGAIETKRNETLETDVHQHLGPHRDSTSGDQPFAAAPTPKSLAF